MDTTHQPIIISSHTTLTYEPWQPSGDPLRDALDAGEISFRRYKALKAAAEAADPMDRTDQN